MSGKNLPAMAVVTVENKQELLTKGYTVVHNVLTEDECQHYIQQFRQWLDGNFKHGEFPLSSHSLIQRYAIGHLEPTWHVRMKSRDVFSQLWETDRLLSSMDAAAIGRPPEQGEEEFYNEETGGWLHLDQTARRVGLHAYQGAVYLETADEDDWTFEVVEGSHALFDEYYTSNPEQQKRAFFRGNMKARDEHLAWMKTRGCAQKRVPAPKGGMLLWDSRLIHANARPKKGRKHPERWRWVVFTCMTPACWATPAALAIKRDAYVNMHMTTHWPCDDVGLMGGRLPSYAARELRPLEQLPEVAQSVQAKRLVGVIPYPKIAPGSKEWDREQELVAIRPKWHQDFIPEELKSEKSWGKCKMGGLLGGTVVHGVLLALAAVLVLFSADFGGGRSFLQALWK